MKTLLTLLVAVIFGCILATITTITTWQFWTIVAIWAFDDLIKNGIDWIVAKTKGADTSEK